MMITQKQYDNVQIVNQRHIRCAKCDLELEIAKVSVSYLKSTFPTRILCCPCCGQYYLSEELVMTKVTEVEQVLEEK